MANEFGLFWDSINHDRLYNAASFEEWLRKFFTTGVFEGECVVTANGGMNLAVSAGYSNLEGKVKFFDTPTYLSLSPAHGQYPRIDTVVIERNDTDREITMKVVTGTYSGTNPVAPAPVRENGIYQIVLAQIRVNAGATEITPINITDTRPNKNLCGIVAGTVEEINFESIQNQFNDWFEHYREELETDPAAHLQNQVDDLKLGYEELSTSKQDNVTGAATTILENDLTANRVLVSNSSGKVGVSGTITPTELGYLDGVTSNVQTQISERIPYEAFEVQPNTTDFDTLIPSKADTIRFDRVNVPAATNQGQPEILTTSKNWSIITFSSVSVSYLWQIAIAQINATRNIMYMRYRNGGSWKNWQKFMTYEVTMGESASLISAATEPFYVKNTYTNKIELIGDMVSFQLNVEFGGTARSAGEYQIGTVPSNYAPTNDVTVNIAPNVVKSNSKVYIKINQAGKILLGNFTDMAYEGIRVSMVYPLKYSLR